MQKKLIALAVAGLASTGAMAQVTFYGVFDAAVVSAKADNTAGDQKFTGLAPGVLSGNRLGFTAEEDLGGGLKAIGRFELGSLNIDDSSGAGTASGSNAAAPGNGITGTRQSYIGLSSDVGTLVLGRVQTPGYDAGVKHDALGGGSVFSPFSLLVNAAAQSQSITNGGAFGRVNNAIAYISPKLAGSTVIKAAVARVNESSTAAASGDIATGGVEFTSGPLEVSFVATQIDELSATADHSEFLLGANYNLGVAKLMAEYVSTERDNATGSDVKGKFFQLGVHVPVGKGTVKLAVASADTDAANTDAAKSFGIDYEHALGKRTTGFVGMNRTKVGDHTGIKIAGQAASNDKAITAFGAGLRLTF